LYEAFAHWVGASLDEVELPLEEYPSLGSFFTRRLREGVRPTLAGPDRLAAPCDGVVASSGRADNGELIQAKGRHYRLSELLADEVLADELEGGEYVTIYLSPRDYHRVHAPMQAQVLGYHYIPGRLQPVSPAFVNAVPDLFARNERVVFHLATAAGPVALVMVGATGVGNISISYAGSNREPVETRRFRSEGEIRRVFHDEPVPVECGDELGIFHLGSTVVMILPPGPRLDLGPECALQVGQSIGQLGGEGAL